MQNSLLNVRRQSLPKATTDKPTEVTDTNITDQNRAIYHHARIFYSCDQQPHDTNCGPLFHSAFNSCIKKNALTRNSSVLPHIRGAEG